MKNLYFDEKVDNAIIKFQTSTDRAEREILCKDFILPAFERLASYWYGRLSLRKNKETIHDCVAYLYEKIPMFSAEKKTRGFAYFNMIARHWFFQKLKNEKREGSISLNSTINLSTDVDDNIIENDALIENSLEKDLEKREFIIIFKEHLPIWRDKSTKDQERIVLDALIDLFGQTENLDIFKKKAVFFWLRELTGMTSKQIASNLVKIKKKYKKLQEAYLRGDI